MIILFLLYVNRKGDVVILLELGIGGHTVPINII